jgi:hypothetical protein
MQCIHKYLRATAKFALRKNIRLGYSNFFQEKTFISVGVLKGKELDDAVDLNTFSGDISHCRSVHIVETSLLQEY